MNTVQNLENIINNLNENTQRNIINQIKNIIIILNKTISENKKNMIETNNNINELRNGIFFNFKKRYKCLKNIIICLSIIIIGLIIAIYSIIPSKNKKNENNIITQNNINSIIGIRNENNITNLYYKCLIEFNISKLCPKNNNINCSTGYYLSNDDMTCKKCSLDNCEKCEDNDGNRNICTSCIKSFTPIYENNVIKSCDYTCNITDENSCLSFDIINKNCLSCDIGYKLKDGKCFLNYSFKAVYQTQKLNENIQLINSSYIKDIIEITVNEIKIIPTNNYTFPNPGEHIVYFLIKDNETTEYMFYNITMNSIVFTKCFNTENIKNMSHMFGGSKNLKSIDISSFNTENVEDLSHMFSQCINLTYINISNFNTQKVRDLSYMFNDCNKLKYVDISKLDSKNVI